MNHLMTGCPVRNQTQGNCMCCVDLAVGSSENFFVTSQQNTVAVFCVIRRVTKLNNYI